ncbi:helix-turn-helix transcriptional regulator [Motilibacter aurantiacus]|uniref:helix-turn-helix transcriptional regulator n=1 Tax=Motilibacter aurantiacus TaxID=2714955 RepID=UPI00140C12FA|nr:YafY family protein [Motilibacter aurantiacus]NHC47651.1 YafY family transcriptional regulator [Motilibacter aurantiacus]
MAVTSARTLRLLSLLQSRRHWPGDDLADRLGVSIRTLRRDIERLRELGYPVQAQRGVDGGYALAPGAALPPLVLDDDEAVALAVGLSAAAATGVDGLAEPSVRALAKVVPVMPTRLRRRVDALRTVTVRGSWAAESPPGSGVDPAVLAVVALACRDAERLAFGYASANGARSEREVEPFRLVPLGRRWYLVAWDPARSDWRVFQLDRLSAPRTTGGRFAPRRLPAADAAEFVRERVSGGAERYEVEAVVDAPAEAVRRRFRWWLSVEDLGEGRCRVRLDVDDLTWAAVALGLVGAGFEVLRPPELRGALRDMAARFAAAAGR